MFKEPTTSHTCCVFIVTYCAFVFVSELLGQVCRLKKGEFTNVVGL